MAKIEKNPHERIKYEEPGDEGSNPSFSENTLETIEKSIEKMMEEYAKLQELRTQIEAALSKCCSTLNELGVQNESYTKKIERAQRLLDSDLAKDQGNSELLSEVRFSETLHAIINDAKAALETIHKKQDEEKEKEEEGKQKLANVDKKQAQIKKNTESILKNIIDER